MPDFEHLFSVTISRLLRLIENRQEDEILNPNVSGQTNVCTLQRVPINTSEGMFDFSI